jgi:hypothetical protein
MRAQLQQRFAIPNFRTGNASPLKPSAVGVNLNVVAAKWVSAYAVAFGRVFGGGATASQRVYLSRDKLKVYGIAAQKIAAKVINFSVLLTFWNRMDEPCKHETVHMSIDILASAKDVAPTISVAGNPFGCFPAGRTVKESFIGHLYSGKDAAQFFPVQVAYSKIFNSHIAFSLTESVRGWGQLGGRTSSWPVCILAQ